MELMKGNTVCSVDIPNPKLHEREKINYLKMRRMIIYNKVLTGYITHQSHLRPYLIVISVGDRQLGVDVDRELI
jgi:hypothetical protein